MSHLLRADGPAVDYLPLFEGAAKAGVRLGWLELETPPLLDPALEAQVRAGAFRAVRVGGGHCVTAKAIKGEPVLRDLVREHFKGCLAVLVRSGGGLPLLKATGTGWELEDLTGRRRELSSDALLAYLRRP